MASEVNFHQWKTRVTAHVQQSSRPLIVILGPTASGKTAFSLAVAAFLGSKGEMVNADSRQLYKHLNIGTAKITPEEMNGVPHHLMDVLDPKQEATIAHYKDLATTEIEEILARQHIPILVGGSMLYISAIIDGLDPLPAADPALREKLQAEYDQDQGISLHHRLEEIDPDSAASIPVQNKIYLVRAMEMYETMKERPSALKKKKDVPYDLLIFGMDVQAEELSTKINQRVHQMFEQGWIDEVQSLLDRGYTINDPGMKSHGYREIAEAIQSGSMDQTSLKNHIASKTRQYAKRQRTWWRGDSRIQWLKI